MPATRRRSVEAAARSCLPVGVASFVSQSAAGRVWSIHRSLQQRSHSNGDGRVVLFLFVHRAERKKLTARSSATLLLLSCVVIRYPRQV